MERRKGTEAEKGIGYFAALCEMAPSDIEAMDASDFARLGEVIQGFHPPRRRAKAGVLILAKLSGWGLDELLDLEVTELRAWIKSAQKLEREINRNVRK